MPSTSKARKGLETLLKARKSFKRKLEETIHQAIPSPSKEEKKEPELKKVNIKLKNLKDVFQKIKKYLSLKRNYKN